MRWLPFIILTISLYSCKQPKNATGYNDKEVVKEVKRQILEIVPSESVAISYVTTSTGVLGDKKAVGYLLKNPEIDLKNDSLTLKYATQIEKIIRSEMKNLSNFNGFNIVFENREEISPSFNKQETVTYRFNTAQP